MQSATECGTEKVLLVVAITAAVFILALWLLGENIPSKVRDAILAMMQ
jgi:hypothetical protein